MAAKLKVFRLGMNASVYGRVKTMLGMTGVHNQATILVVAPSKAAAFGLASAMPNISVPSLSDPEFRLAAGEDVDALTAAGQLDTVRVLAFHPTRSDTVVEIRVDGEHQTIGQLVRGEGYTYRFEPAGGA